MTDRRAAQLIIGRVPCSAAFIGFPLVTDGGDSERVFMSIHSASTDPDIGLAEAIDQNGRARYEAVSAGVVNDDSAIAPWIDIPVGLSGFGY